MDNLPNHNSVMKTIREVLLALCIAGVPAAMAQTYSIDWFSIDGGGGTSSGGGYILSGTIGQPDAGRMSGGSYTLEGGFWSVLAVIQSSEGPQLFIERNTGGGVILSWESPSAGFVLQETSMILAPPFSTVWVEVAEEPVVEDGRNRVTVATPTGHRFYRLVRPES